nr:hypothetical protein [Methanobrevibacter arboriphilus]
MMKILKNILFKDKFFISFLFALILLLFFSLSSASAEEYNFTTGNTTEQFQSVIDNDVDDELVINLDDGNYSLNRINVSRNATIQGKNSSNVKISGSGILFDIKVPNVKIINLTMVGYDTAIYANDNINNLMIIGNNIKGPNGVFLIGNIDVFFANNSIIGTSGSGIYLNAFFCSNLNLTFADNYIEGSEFGFFAVLVMSFDSNFNFTKNNIQGIEKALALGTIMSNNLNFSFIDNIIQGMNYAVDMDVSNSEKLQFNFTNNEIIGDNFSVRVFGSSNFGKCYFLNNNINSISGDGFYFQSEQSGLISDFIVMGNTLISNGTGLNFRGLYSGSLVNVTVEYNRIIAPVGVNISDFDNGSSFDFNWWGVNDITGKTLGVNTSNHFILNVTNLTSLDNLRFGDNVSFAFLVLNTSMDNSGVEYLPYFVVNGTYNNQTFVVDNFSNFTDVWTVSSGDNVFAATLDSQDVGFTFSASKLDTNSTISVDDVHVGTIAVISGQLDNYAGNGSDLLNVTVDGNLYENVVINSTGGWNLTYLTNRTGNITVTVDYSGNDNYTSFSNSTSFDVLKNSTNSTIDVAGDFKVGENISISGILVDGDIDPIDNAQITVTVNNESFNVTTNSSGVWSLVYAPIHGGEFLILVNWAGNDNYTGFNNTTSFNVTKLASNSSIVIPVDIKVNETVLISGVLTDENNNTISGANLEVIVDGESFNVTTDSVGVWGLNYTPEHSGVFNLSLFYQGDSRYVGFVENKVFNVSKLATTSSIIIPSNVKVGKPFSVSGVLTSGGKPLANASVLVSVGGKIYKVTTNGLGVWKLSYTPKKAGKSTMKVSFVGNDDYLGFNVSKTFKVVGKVKIGIVKISKLVKVGKYRGFNLYSKVYTIKNVGSAVGSKDYVKYFKNWYLEKLSKTSKIVKYQFITKSRILKVQVKNLGVGKQVKMKILVTHRKRL